MSPMQWVLISLGWLSNALWREDGGQQNAAVFALQVIIYMPYYFSPS